MLEGKNNTFSLLWEIRSIFNMAAVKTFYSNAAFKVLDKWTCLFLCIIGSRKHIFEDSEYEKLLEC